jgi:hypothetical protein
MVQVNNMGRSLNIELFGPASNEDGLRPVIGDTVAIVSESGRVQFTSITGAVHGEQGMVLYSASGQRLMPEECYFVYTLDEGSVE